MNRAAKIKFIGKKLDELYPNPPIPLNYTNPFTMLVAVVLSAQCTDIRVNQVTAHLFKQADSPAKMIKLGVERIAEIIKPCGFFNTKSANIFKLSQALVEKFEG
ncbi:MAG: endonuclease III, partial [Fibrobacter sp.]|nr:endonuclease III [Fibrobacter sp.]